MIKWKSKKKQPKEHFVAEAPFTNVGEQFRIIRTKILQYQNRTGAKSFLVTSPSKGEGKSFVTANLAIVFAELNKKVLILEANLRNPSVHKYFHKIENAEQNQSDIQFPTIYQTNKPNIYIIDHEKLTYNPSTFFSNGNLRVAMDILKDQFDLILVDAPHAINIPELLTLLMNVDSVIGVVNYRKTLKKEWKTFGEIMDSIGKCDYLTVINSKNK